MSTFVQIASFTSVSGKFDETKDTRSINEKLITVLTLHRFILDLFCAKRALFHNITVLLILKSLSFCSLANLHNCLIARS